MLLVTVSRSVNTACRAEPWMRNGAATSVVGDARPKERHQDLGGASSRLLSRACSSSPARAVSTDVCVPISRLAECVTQIRQGDRERLHADPALRPRRRRQLPLVILIDPNSRAELDEAKALNARLVERRAMEGTCTGEHGIGMGKQGSLQAELGEDVIGLMRDIKKLFDPTI